MLGQAVLNCYNPINRKTVSMAEFDFRKFSEKTFVPLLHNDGELSNDCINNSQITPNNILIANSCPRQICLNLNYLSPKDEKDWVFNKDQKRYCRQ
jgi:hypothetical protein